MQLDTHNLPLSGSQFNDSVRPMELFMTSFNTELDMSYNKVVNEGQIMPIFWSWLYRTVKEIGREEVWIPAPGELEISSTIRKAKSCLKVVK